ncbi:MAG TPA: hypothetical protein VFV23_07600 [Verrucomicrobiae bacterium]|nr:hypothetical protein [Verrucomicrobiae bacterium]
MALKRNGESCKYTVPDFIGKLTSAEFDAYNEAFNAIKDEFASLEQIKNEIKELAGNPSVQLIPDSQFLNESVTTQHSERGDLNLHWDIRSRLLKLNCSDVLLCERMTADGKQFAVIERYKNDSAYARANGNANVLLVSDDVSEAVQDYIANAEHTLRFMASNMVATAQTVVWERFANQSPARVIRAISERCAKAAGEAQNEIQAQIFEHRISQRQSSIGRRV